MIVLQLIKRTDIRILANMDIHYSKPKGFVGRNICYAILFNGNYYGSIVGGSATRFLPGRDEFFNWSNGKRLNYTINNIFYHIERINGKYPMRWFSVKVLFEYMKRIQDEWFKRYGDIPEGHETLVELPRLGQLYKKAGWTRVGQTKGYTCKRVGGTGTDGWTGKRVWDTKNLRPKLVFVNTII